VSLLTWKNRALSQAMLWDNSGVEKFLFLMMIMLKLTSKLEILLSSQPPKQTPALRLVGLKEYRYWDTGQQNPAHTQQSPEQCYAMVVATVDRNIIVYNLANPQIEFKRRKSPLKCQMRCVATFPEKQGFLVISKTEANLTQSFHFF
jgi:hypothetical protein